MGWEGVGRGGEWEAEKRHGKGGVRDWVCRYLLSFLPRRSVGGKMVLLGGN